MAPPGRASLPLGRRVLYIEVLKYMDFAWNSQKLDNRTHASTQAAAALIFKLKRRYAGGFKAIGMDFVMHEGAIRWDAYLHQCEDMVHVLNGVRSRALILRYSKS